MATTLPRLFVAVKRKKHQPIIKQLTFQGKYCSAIAHRNAMGPGGSDRSAR